MDENKIETKARNEPDKPKKEKSAEERQRNKMRIIIPICCVLCGVIMWIIFKPSAKDKEAQQQQQGYNTDVPSPSNKQMTDDKKTAYEQAQMEKKDNDRRQQMQDLASMFGREEEPEEALYEEEPQRSYSSGGKSGTSRPRETIYASAHAYNDINRTLGNFYEEPKVDPEKEEMQKRIDELSAAVEAQQQPQGGGVDEQIALMEKSYELAAKYMPSGQQPGSPTGGTPTAPESKAVETVRNGKAMINSVGQVTASVVTTLSQPMSDSTFIAEYSKERNMGFHTAVGTQNKMDKNTIKACVHSNQTIMDGQAVRFRLLEPMRVSETVIPRNALVTGMAKIQGDRLGVDITSLEYAGTIILVELTVYDSDGQEGIFIPGSIELNAVKEVAANMGASLGTSVSITNQGAGDQLLTELGKGAIQGVSQYISKKMKVVKVHLKAGYNIMLYQDKN